MSMTQMEAVAAMNAATLVCAGKPGTEDYDEGVIVSVSEVTADVAWNSGTVTFCPLEDLDTV